PESSIKGAEIQIDWLPVTGLRFGLGAAYLDTEITGTFNNFSAFGQPIDFKGYGFANTPKWQANASVEYRWPVSDTLGAYVGANANYRSDTNGDF
ncbi:TonB-dependent receptor domain-containing protein, partial [Candidatus Clostridium helianthi]